MTQPELELWPLVVYAFAVVAVVAGMLALPQLLGERHHRKPERQHERGTADPYESGIMPTGTARLRLPVQYYQAAMFFVIFDVEAVFIYAWAVEVRENGWRGFAEIAIFIAILLAALVYLWRVGALEWGVQYGRVDHPRQVKPDARVA